MDRFKHIRYFLVSSFSSSKRIAFAYELVNNVLMNISLVKNLITNEIFFKSGNERDVFPDVVELDRRFFSFQLRSSQVHWNSQCLVAGTIPLLYPDPKQKDRFLTQTVAFEFTGKMTLLDNLEGHVLLRFDLLQYNRSLWLQFLQQRQFKQIRVDNFFNLIKGEA